MRSLPRRFLALVVALGGLALCLQSWLPRLAPSGTGARTADRGPVPAPKEEPLPDPRPPFRSLLAEAARRPVLPTRILPFQGTTPESAPPAVVAEGLPEIHPPLDFRARDQEGGIRLSWVQDPRNPVEGIRYRIRRWAGEADPVDLPPVEGLEYLDQVECEGIHYQYRLRAELIRELPGPEGPRTVTRLSSAVAASATLPRRAQWVALGRDEEGRILLLLRRPGHPEGGPWAARAGQPIGDSGWFLEGMSLHETVREMETRVPRFDALGRRVIINGRPADHTRLVKVHPVLASLRLSDPCGASTSVELELPVAHPTGPGD